MVYSSQRVDHIESSPINNIAEDQLKLRENIEKELIQMIFFKNLVFSNTQGHHLIWVQPDEVETYFYCHCVVWYVLIT